MQTIKIEKLEELNDFEWEYKNKKFLLLDSVAFDDMLTLVEKNYIDVDGYMSEKRYRSFSLKNLKELEFFGLKVILNEKPKLTKEERTMFENIANDFWISRDENKRMQLTRYRPYAAEEYKHWKCSGDDLIIKSSLLPFITWESRKAWSKAELMELEVVE